MRLFVWAVMCGGSVVREKVARLEREVAMLAEKVPAMAVGRSGDADKSVAVATLSLDAAG